MHADMRDLCDVIHQRHQAQNAEQERIDAAEETAKAEVAAMITADLTPNSDGKRALSVNELAQKLNPRVFVIDFSDAADAKQQGKVRSTTRMHILFIRSFRGSLAGSFFATSLTKITTLKNTNHNN